MNKNRKCNKRRNNYPSPVQRLDDILVAEINLAVKLGISDATILKNYKITQSQLVYCKNKKNVSFNDIYKEENE